MFGERYGFENRPRGHGTFDRKPTASGSRFVLKHRSFAQSCSARGRENAWCRSAVSPVLRLAAAIVVFLRFFVFPVQNSDCRVGVRSSRGSLARHRRRENQTSYDRRSFEMRKSHARNDNTIRRHTVRIFFFFYFCQFLVLADAEIVDCGNARVVRNSDGRARFRELAFSITDSRRSRIQTPARRRSDSVATTSR